MRDLPDHQSSVSATDHYLVVVGLDGPNLLVNDPAMPAALGYRRPLGPEELERAWADSAMPRHAAAFAATSEVRELALPDPLTPTPVPTFAAGVDPNPPPLMLGRDPAPLPDAESSPTATPPPSDALTLPSPRGRGDASEAPSPEAGALPASMRLRVPASGAAEDGAALDGRASAAEAEARLLTKLTEHGSVADQDVVVSPIGVDDLPAPRVRGPLFPLQLYVPRHPPWLNRPARPARWPRSPGGGASASPSRRRSRPA